jgi:hypothetical protein
VTALSVRRLLGSNLREDLSVVAVGAFERVAVDSFVVVVAVNCGA